MTTTYSNPRTEATIPDWPSGKHRVTAKFWVERDPKRGERVVRTTTRTWPSPQGSTSAPKKLTYAKKARIVDGDDGRVYVLELSPFSGHITVMRGTMDYTYETLFERDDPARYADLMKLFEGE